MLAKTLLAVAVAAAAVSTQAASLEEVTIIGDPADAQQLPGSAHVVDAQELAKFEYTDINRMIRQVPGVYLQEEDGFGLRPNIGIRGAGAERSEKITLMEDGVLIAPAPYSAPSAYYFPTAGRMSGVEVLKGANILRHGPSTVGGVVNLISTRIPDEARGQMNVELAEDGGQRVAARYGDSKENFGWLLETQQQENDGFKDIDRSSQDSGFDIEDYVAKVRFNTDSDAALYQQLDIKVQYSEETSNETYVGLTNSDFDADAQRRYGLTALDEMQTRHSGVNFRYLMKPSDDLSLTTTVYYNKFQRDWFKVKGIGNVIADANAGDANAQAILDGTQDTSVNIKHNNRQYVSKGVQFAADWNLGDHQLQTGIRYHEDEVDRFQPEEIFDQINGELVFNSIVSPSSSNNRVEDTQALSTHIMDVWSVSDALELTLGLRYEDYDTGQTRYGDIDRNTVASTRQNKVDKLLWSAGVTYELDTEWQLLAGVHSGFAPTSPSDKENIEPEQSTNYEAGVRFNGEGLSVSAIAFWSDYENKVSNCSAAFPCGSVTSGSQSQGESEVKGLEFTLENSLFRSDKLTVPLMISYTYTDAKITDANGSGSQDGDLLRYVPENVFSAQIGVELASGWNTYVSANYIDEMCHDSTCDRSGFNDAFLRTDDLLVVDVATHFPLNESTNLYLKLDNAFNAEEIVSRAPDGARPNKPRTVTAGVKFEF